MMVMVMMVVMMMVGVFDDYDGDDGHAWQWR